MIKGNQRVSHFLNYYTVYIIWAVNLMKFIVKLWKEPSNIKEPPFASLFVFSSASEFKSDNDLSKKNDERKVKKGWRVEWRK